MRLSSLLNQWAAYWFSVLISNFNLSLHRFFIYQAFEC